jgi:hypothetical protein
MADPELIRALDFILNRCDAAAIEAVAEAVVRRRRELALFGGRVSAPDPRRWAAELSSQLNLQGAVDGLTKSVRDYAIRIIKQEAPELSDAQIGELTRSWIPSADRGEDYPDPSQKGKIPRDLLASMIDQFVSFSLNRMEPGEEGALRKEMGPWPDRYWKAFPPVFKAIIKDFLKGEMTEEDFNNRVGTALSMR